MRCRSAISMWWPTQETGIMVLYAIDAVIASARTTTPAPGVAPRSRDRHPWDRELTGGPDETSWADGRSPAGLGGRVKLGVRLHRVGREDLLVTMGAAGLRAAIEQVGADCHFAVLAEVQAELFLPFGHPQGDDQVGELVEDQRADEGEGRHDHQAQQMIQEGHGRTVPEADLLGEETGEDHASNTADAVAGEDVERIVERRFGPQVHGQVADDAGRQADDDAVLDGDVASGGSDGDQPDDRADAGPHRRGLLP